jgi:hypothetical protein
MSGSKTRYGFTGDGGEPPDSDEAQAARTILGHDIHLQLPPGFVPPKAPAVPMAVPVAAPIQPTVRTPIPPGRVMTAVQEETTDPVPYRRPYRYQKSGLARFFGRWTDSGRFESRSKLDARDQDVRLPRDSTGRNVLLVLAVAVLTFIITFAIVKLRQRFISDPLDIIDQVPTKPQPPGTSPSAVPSAVPPPALPSPPSQQPNGPPPAVAAPSPPSLAKQAIPASPTAAKDERHPNSEPHAHKATQRSQKPHPFKSKATAEPPGHLKGELLPLQP